MCIHLLRTHTLSRALPVNIFDVIEEDTRWSMKLLRRKYFEHHLQTWKVFRRTRWTRLGEPSLNMFWGTIVIYGSRNIFKHVGGNYYVLGNHRKTCFRRLSLFVFHGKIMKRTSGWLLRYVWGSHDYILGNHRDTFYSSQDETYLSEPLLNKF